jgi:adenylate cyclase
MKKMVELEPENSSSHFGLGFFYAQTDQVARSIAPFEESLRLTPEDTVVHMNLVMAYDLAGDKQGRIRSAERALPVLEKRIRLVPDDENARVLHADLLQRAGRNEEATTALVKLNGITDGNSLYNLACLAARLDERDRAIEFLLASVKAGFANIELFHSDPDLDPLRELPEFQDLMKELEEGFNT